MPRHWKLCPDHSGILLMSQPDKPKHFMMAIPIQSWDNAKTDTRRGDQPKRKNDSKKKKKRQAKKTQDMSHAVLTTFSLIVWNKLLIIVRYLS